MRTSLEVLFTPAEFAALERRDLSNVLCVVFDVLRATADKLAVAENVILVCSGTFDQVAYEDTLAAGAMCDLLWPMHGSGAVSDSAHMARKLYHLEKDDLLAGISKSRNGRRLLANPDLKDDVAFCVQGDVYGLTAVLRDGALSRND